MNFHAPVPYRGYETALNEHYARVRSRLVGVPVAQPAIPALFLPVPTEQHAVPDLVPNQIGRAAIDIRPIGTDAEIIAARRALMIFARLREESPHTNSVRHIQTAVAQAFRVDLWTMLGRTKRNGPSRIRQIAMMLAMRVCDLSRNKIAIRFDRNHSTVLFAEKKFAAFLDGATSTIGGA